MKKSSNIKYVAIDSKDNTKIIARGKSIANVAKKTEGIDCIISPEFKEGITYIL